MQEQVERWVHRDKVTGKYLNASTGYGYYDADLADARVYVNTKHKPGPRHNRTKDDYEFVKVIVTLAQDLERPREL